MQSPKKKRNYLERALEFAADAGSIAMNLRDQPTRLDWISLTLRGVSLASRIRKDLRSSAAKSPWSFFDSEGFDPTWVAIPESLGELVLKHVRAVKIEEGYWDGDNDSCRVHTAMLENECIGWVADSDGDVVEGPFMRVERAEETHAALGRLLWKELGSDRLVFGTNGLSLDPFETRGALPTEQFTGLLQRLRIFSGKDISRSMLFAGPPGTGKSTGMRQLVAGLGLRSLRVDIKLMSQRHGGHELTASLETLVRALAPEALILDDIDRVQQEEQLLHFFERANQSCALVLASVNDLKSMSSALLRPGRFDEIITVDKPDPLVVRALLGEEQELFDRLSKLPIAYVVEFVKRRSALGKEVACKELEGLVARYEQAKA